MKGYILFGGFLLLSTTVTAQTRISGTLKCDKPEPAYQIEVGDRPGHIMALEKLSCTWATPIDMGGDKAKDASVVVSVDVTPTRSAASGAGVSTNESGDKAFTVIRDTTVIKNGKPEPTQGTWSYSGGTGKLKGIKGKGTYKTTLNEDRTSTVEVEGEYELPKPKSPQGK